MPFKNQRNSRDDNSKKKRSNSESFGSKGGQDKRSFSPKGNDSFGKTSKFNKPFDKSDDRSKGRTFGSTSGKSFGKRTEEGEDRSRSFKSNRPFDKTDDRSNSRSFDASKGKSFSRRSEQGGDNSRGFKSNRSFDRSDDRAKSRSFDATKRSFGKRTEEGGDSSRGFKSNRSFDRSDDRAKSRNFGDGSKRPYDNQRSDTDRKGKDARARKPFDRANSNEQNLDSFNRRSYNERQSDTETNETDFKYSGRRKFSPAKRPATKEVDDDGLIRLNRYISNSGICSRRKADELITAGVITVNGEAVTELGTKVDPAKDEIRYNNERLKREKMVYVLLNKPKDYITTTDDPQERRTVMQLVAKATKERIYPVGRLDRNTTGLLLLTNDGNLADKLSHPKNNVTKIYQIELNKALTQGDFNKIEFGLELEDGFIKPDDLSYVQGASKREIGIQIHSGKNRIVRRIFESLGYEVIKLDRVVYAGLTKKDLPRGRWRYLEEKELIQLKHLIK